MSDSKEKETDEKAKDSKSEKKPLTAKKSGGTLSLKGSKLSGEQLRQSMTQGGRAGSGTVAVEVRRSKRTAEKTPEPEVTADDSSELSKLTDEERNARAQALKKAIEDDKKKAEELKQRQAEDAKSAKDKKAAEEELAEAESELSEREKELAELQRIEEEEKAKTAARDAQRDEQAKKFQEAMPPQPQPAGQKPSGGRGRDDDDEQPKRKRMAPSRRSITTDRRRSGKITVQQALSDNYERDSRIPSLAAQKRAREKERRQMMMEEQGQQKKTRDVVVPEHITVQELDNRMAERSADVVKELMKMGVMATVNQTIDADTAELLVEEFGHKIKRVTDADVEIGLEGSEDKETDLIPRPPVVTVMGHVDHGKTSLLDAMRSSNVASGEAGGITQHIGAYQVTSPGGQLITFLDTPGHAAFTEMRARGANVTDIVILVVAADDSVMPQTIEAISHAKAAKVPVIVAINKIDVEGANPMKIKQDLLQHEIVLEDMGGEVLCVEVSAKQRTNLEALEEAILLQSEILDLKANPNREAQGTVVEAKLEKGRGAVATILIQKGTLKLGDIFVTGNEWGRVRALINDRGENIQEAVPGQPVEVLGLNGAPSSGDDFSVVDSEARAREITEYRMRKKRDTVAAGSVAKTGSFEQMLALQNKDGEAKTLPIIIKADVHGSVEAIIGSLEKIAEENEEIAVSVLHSGVGGITESDVTLAGASKALIVGFNVRANRQARDLANQNGVDLRYYSVIYDVIDDAKAMLSGMLDPTIRETFLGNAEIKQVFSVSKVGKVAGCIVTEGVVKRGSKVRLLRDDVVIHEGTLKTLQRFKDEVKEVQSGTECGMAFENYDDIKEGDVIECFDVEEVARKIA